MTFFYFFWFPSSSSLLYPTTTDTHFTDKTPLYSSCFCNRLTVHPLSLSHLFVFWFRAAKQRFVAASANRGICGH